MNRLSMNLLPLHGYCGMDAIIQGTGGITGIGIIIISPGTDAIIRHIISIMPADGMKADTIIMLHPADRHGAAIAAAAMIAAEADAAAAEEEETAEEETAEAADGISPQSL